MPHPVPLATDAHRVASALVYALPRGGDRDALLSILGRQETALRGLFAARGRDLGAHVRAVLTECGDPLAVIGVQVREGYRQRRRYVGLGADIDRDLWRAALAVFYVARSPRVVAGLAAPAELRRAA